MVVFTRSLSMHSFSTSLQKANGGIYKISNTKYVCHDALKGLQKGGIYKGVR